MKRILYVGWLGFNNIGDELMWLLFRDLCRTYLPWRNYDVIPSIPGVDIKNTGPYDTVVLGGGSLLIPGYIDTVYKAAEKGKNVIVWGSGHDRTEYPLVGDSGEVQTNLAFVGEHRPVNAFAAETVRRSVFCGVRGPLTEQFLRHAGAPMDKVVISGDPGFLLPNPAGPARPDRGRPVIGVNWGTAYNRIYGGSEENVERHLAEALRRLIAEGYNVTIFPVWGPDREACRRLYDKLEDKEYVKLDPELRHHEDLIEIIQSYALTINFKLHANYLSLAAGVPFICLGYRFKSLDFGYSAGLQEYVLPTHREDLMQSILDSAARIEKEKDELRERFLEVQIRYRSLLERPFREKLL